MRVFGSDVARHGVGLRGRIGYMPEREGVTPGLNGIEYVGLSGELNGMPRKLALRLVSVKLDGFRGIAEKHPLGMEQVTENSESQALVIELGKYINELERRIEAE